MIWRARENGLWPGIEQYVQLLHEVGALPRGDGLHHMFEMVLGTEPSASRICSADSTGRPSLTGAEAMAWSMIEKRIAHGPVACFG